MRTVHANTGRISLQVGATLGLLLLLAGIVVVLWQYGDANWFQSAFARSVQLQAPHIAETTEPRMDAMEAVMQRLDAQVTDALQSLQALVDEPGRPFLEAARASYTDFHNFNAHIIDLSRQNSNIRSFALSLGQKRKLTAQCQDALAALQEHVQQSMRYKATQ